MRILLLSTAHNSLSQRVQVELEDLGHYVTLELALSDELITTAVTLSQPDIIVCPFLTKKLDESIYKKYVCLIVHPGPLGDAGPSSLDWAIYNNEKQWGVTVLQASEEMDGGDVWSTKMFALPSNTTKSVVYKTCVVPNAVQAVIEAIDKFSNGGQPTSLCDLKKIGIERPFMKQTVRGFNFDTDSAMDIVKKCQLSDTQPGILHSISGKKFYMYGAHVETVLESDAVPGTIIATRANAVCFKCVDHAVWFTHLRQSKVATVDKFVGLHPKLPATICLNRAGVSFDVTDSPAPHPSILLSKQQSTFREVWFTVEQDIATLYWEFYNGAMNTDQCYLLTKTFAELALNDDIKGIILAGGIGYFSNGIHLCTIEVAPDPAEESWLNINGIDDFVREVIYCKKPTVTVFRSNAGAGGVIMGLASDYVFGSSQVVLNPHYKGMGLYGSEYWTYLLPKRVGYEKAIEYTESMLPVSMKQAISTGMVDSYGSIDDAFKHILNIVSNSTTYDEFITKKHDSLKEQETIKPIDSYREEELVKMKENFAKGSKYHDSRHAFVYKLAPTVTPEQFAIHRRTLQETKTDFKVYDCAYQLR